MNILQVIDIFSPLYGGGSSEVVFQLSNALAKKGNKVEIYASDFGAEKEYIDSLAGVKISIFKTWLNFSGFRISPGIIKKAKKELKNFDIIHMHNFRTFQNVIISYYAKKQNIPYIIHAHSPIASFFYKKGLKIFFNKIWGYRILKNASKIFVSSSDEIEQYINIGINKNKIQIISNGINLNDFKNLSNKGEFRKKYNISNDEKLILYLGRLHKIKGLDILVKAFAEVSSELSNIKLALVGPDVGYFSFLKKLSEELKIQDKIVFTDYLYKKEKLEAYIDADIFVSPSRYEIFSLVLSEAMICGLPVIITDRFGIRDTIKKYQAGLIIPFDKGELKKAIIDLILNKQKAHQMGQNGKLLVEQKYNWHKISIQIQDIYKKIINLTA